MISSECNTQWFMSFFRVWIVVIATAVIVLAWLTGLVLQWCSPANLTVPLPMEVLDNAWCGSWRPLTNLTQTFRVCHLCTFNVAAIFFRGHPYIWRTTVPHDINHGKEVYMANILYLRPMTEVEGSMIRHIHLLTMVHIIGASLSEPHTSVTALRMCVCMLGGPTIYRKF